MLNMPFFSSVMLSPLRFDGYALASWSDPDIPITIPWYIGLMFRTRKSAGTLLQASAGELSKFSLLVSICRFSSINTHSHRQLNQSISHLIDAHQSNSTRSQVHTKQLNSGLTKMQSWSSGLVL